MFQLGSAKRGHTRRAHAKALWQESRMIEQWEAGEAPGCVLGAVAGNGWICTRLHSVEGMNYEVVLRLNHVHTEDWVFEMGGGGDLRPHCGWTIAETSGNGMLQWEGE